AVFLFLAAPHQAEQEPATEGDAEAGPDAGTDPVPHRLEHVQSVAQVVPLLLDPVLDRVERLGDAAARVLDRAPRFRDAGPLDVPPPATIAPHGSRLASLPHTTLPCHSRPSRSRSLPAGVARIAPRRSLTGRSHRRAAAGGRRAAAGLREASRPSPPLPAAAPLRGARAAAAPPPGPAAAPGPPPPPPRPQRRRGRRGLHRGRRRSSGRDTRSSRRPSRSGRPPRDPEEAFRAECARASPRG